MTELPGNTPVIIGVGQASERPDSPGYAALSHMDLGGRALAAAIADCNAGKQVAAAIDTVAAIRQFEISTPQATAPFGRADNPPRAIAARVGANPYRAILEVVGGQGPQALVGELAATIAAGQSRCAAIVGSEAISTVLGLTAKGESPDWSEHHEGTMEDRGFGMSGMIEPTVIAHGIGYPIPVYAVYDNARRARLGLSADEYRRAIGELFAPFSEVAAANPHAAAPVARTAEELASVTERNRIVAEPYPRMTVARDQVNQAAAIIIASVDEARALGVPEDRWVHIHAVTEAKEHPTIARPDLSASHASIAVVRHALDRAGIGMEAVQHLDLYSCFAIAVFNIIDAFGIAPDDPRGLTLTGGLPFFGGAGNNYSGHGIAEAVARCRAAPGSTALVGANGGFMSKYAAGIYSTRPAEWDASAPRHARVSAPGEALPVIDSHDGEAVVQSYTVVPGPKRTIGVVVAETADGQRLCAMAAPDDAATLAVLQEGEPFGRRIVVQSASGEGPRINSFRFAGW